MRATDINPYAPPQAAVADVHAGGDAVGELRFWSSAGRIGRLRFLAWVTAAYFLFAIGGGVLGAVLGASGSRGLGTLGVVVLSVGGLAYFAFGVIAAIQRAHDMGWSGWSVLAMIIPFVALVWIFNPGTPGANRFGPPPPPNTTGVKILGFLFPAIVAIGIVAAIALPAYQDYSNRAKVRRL